MVDGSINLKRSYWWQLPPRQPNACSKHAEHHPRYHHQLFPNTTTRANLSLITMSGPPPTAQEAPAALSSIQHGTLQAPPSPQTHRALRRLQSAHALGARAAAQASLISQQRREQQLPPSPSRNPVAGSTTRTRGRANSDATPPPLYQPTAASNARRSGVKKPVFSHGHLSLQQIIRDGPNDGDFIGALESARWKVIDEGVKAAEDGMVRDTIVLTACSQS